MRVVTPDKSGLLSTVTGTVDATYSASWLSDGQPNFPAKTTGNMSLTMTRAAAISVDVVAVCHHSIRQAATISLSGDISNTIPTAAYPADSIPHNWFRLLTTPVSVDSLTLGVTGNTDPVIVGECYYGLSQLFTVDFRIGRRFNPGQPFAWEGEYGLMPPYDAGIARPRRLSGEMLIETDAEYADLQRWDAAQRNGNRPSLVIPNDLVNDAWLCYFHYEESYDTALHYVTIEIVEIPRIRWP